MLLDRCGSDSLADKGDEFHFHSDNILIKSNNFNFTVAIREAPAKGKMKSDRFNSHVFLCNYIFLLVYISIKVNSKPIEYLIQCFSANYWHSVQSIWVLLLFLLSCLKCCKAELF